MQCSKRLLTAALAAAMATAGLVGAAGLNPTPAEAAYAGDGAGRFVETIDWFEWGSSAAAIPPEGMTKTNTREVAGATLATTCTISDIKGLLQAYTSGTWRGDALDELYNTGGTGVRNTMVTGLANTLPGNPSTFRFDCGATLNGIPIPLQGLVIGDAESSTEANATHVGEYVQARTEPPVVWRIIDRYRAPGCTTNTLATLEADNTLRLSPDGLECVAQNRNWAGPVAVGFMQGATGAEISLQGGGNSAVALGVVLQTDFGDAPASYGQAGSLFEPGWEGGTVPVGTTPVSDEGFVLAGQGQPLTRLGATVDAEVAHQPSPNALGDDTINGADEDAVKAPGTISATPGSPYALGNVQCSGPGSVAGWIDWNHNGAFDNGERSGIEKCLGSSVDLAWTVPADAVDSPADNPTFLRLRIAPDDAAASSATGLTTSGEVEDHALAVSLPALSVAKTSNATADSRPGDKISYTVRATNTGGSDFTGSYPAVVLDDLTGVLDDASYMSDAVASRPGALSAQSPLLGWVGALPAGQSVEISYTTTLKGGGDGLVRNVAWAPAEPQNPLTPRCDPATGQGTDSVSGEPCAVAAFELPKLSITKSANTAELPAVGERANFTVVVTNEGPGDYTATAPAAMSDDLAAVSDDADFDPASLTASTGKAGYTGGVVSWSGALAAGESATITYSTVYTGEGNQQLVNRACVPVAETAAGSASCATVTINGSDLLQWKTVQASATPAVAGTELSYTLHFQNTGQAAARVDSLDLLDHVLDDADISVGPAAGTGLTAVRDGASISITGMVPAGETVTVSYTATVKADGERGDDVASNFLLHNDPDVPPALPATPACVPVDAAFADCTGTPIGAIAYTKEVTASADPVAAGSTLTYTITVNSTGKAEMSVAREDVLNDVLDDATISEQPSSDTDTVTATGIDNGRFALAGTLAGGQTAKVSYSVTVNDEATRGNNTADNFLVAPGTNPPAACVAGATDCTATPLPNVSVVKSANPTSGTPVDAGQEVSYTLTFTNTGQATGNVDHTDILTDVLDDAAITGAPSSQTLTAGAVSKGQFTTTGALAPGGTATVDYTVKVNADGQRGNDFLGNFVVKTGQTPSTSCVDGSTTCTTHPVTTRSGDVPEPLGAPANPQQPVPEGPAALVATGAAQTAGALALTLLLLTAGGALVLVNRRQVQ